MFKCVRSECQKNDGDIIEAITRLGKYLLKLQQISAQEVVYIYLSMRLNISSRKYIFINNSTIDYQTLLETKRA